MTPLHQRKTIYVFGEGLVGGLLIKKLKECGEFNVVSSKEVTVAPKRITSINPGEDLRAIFTDLITGRGKPDLIINAMGTIGKPNVDWCEDHQEETRYGNIYIPLELFSIAAEELNVPMIHLSTGCIFSDVERVMDTEVYSIFGTQSEPNFTGSYYSWSKARAEGLLKALHKGVKGAVLDIHRIRMPFFGWKDPRNLFNKLLAYDTLVDSPNSMTCLEDYADYVVKRSSELIDFSENNKEDGALNIVHAVNKGPISHKEIIAFMKNNEMEVGEKKYITPKELNTMTKAPRSNCVLGEEVLPDIRVSLITAIREYMAS